MAIIWVKVAVLEVLAVSQMGNMYRFLALDDTTVVPLVEASGSEVMPEPAAPVWIPKTPLVCIVLVEKHMILKLRLNALLLAELTVTAGGSVPSKVSFEATEPSVP